MVRSRASEATSFLSRADPGRTKLRTRLYLSHDPRVDILRALAFGTTDDGQPDECWSRVADEFAYFHLGELGPTVGFKVRRFSGFDVDRAEVSAIWDEPLFDVPVLALRSAPAGAIVRAAQIHFDGRPSLNRVHFRMAVGKEGEEALPHWIACLEAGDSMAHFAIGYTLYDLARYEEAYRHLRYYAEIASYHPWNWVWFGKAAAALGAVGEAREAYQRAIRLEEAGADKTCAWELLQELDSEDEAA